MTVRLVCVCDHRKALKKEHQELRKVQVVSARLDTWVPLLHMSEVMKLRSRFGAWVCAYALAVATRTYSHGTLPVQALCCQERHMAESDDEANCGTGTKRS